MTDPNSQPVRVLVAYYSATGVEELAPGLLISQNQACGRHRSEVGELWQRGELINKVVAAFTSSQTVHVRR